MYDILLLSLPKMDKDKPSPAPAYLKSILNQKGFSSKFIDGNFLESEAKIFKEITKNTFKWLGISVFSYEQIEIAQRIGEKFPNVIYGGSGVSKNWGKKNYIVGEGEYALVEFLKGNYNYPGINGLEPKQIDDLNSLPAPDYSDVLDNGYKNYTMSGSRGCVRNCTFCDVANIWPKYRWWNGDTVAKNMHIIAEQTKTKNITFSDSLVNGSMKHFRELCYNLAKTNRKLNWSGQFIIRDKKTFSQTDFDNLGNSGCSQLSIGIESGSETVRRHMKKSFSNEDLDYFLNNLNDRKIKMKFLLIVGYPTETDKDFNETLELLKKYKHISKNIQVSPHMMLVDKETPLDIHHRDLFDEYGFYFKSQFNNYSSRLKRFKKIFEVGQELGYGFKQHALDKLEKFKEIS